jgi:histidinol dehydrogenase
VTAQLYHWSELNDVAREKILQRPALDRRRKIRAAAKSIIAKVKRDRDAALVEYTKRFDHADMVNFRAPAAEVEAALAVMTAQQVAAIDLAIDNIRRFHERQLPTPIRVETMPGIVCERLSQPIDAVGLYVPAGTAPLPSAAIMLAVPALIAACPKVVLCTPPRPDGSADPAVLVAASRAGVAEIYKIGGAQAIAAMAYGTESIPRVCKIFGPGNAWVTMAKSLVSGDPSGAAIDLPAGPSEMLVIGDESATAEFIAADLLSQAEHGVDSQVIFISTCKTLAVAVQTELVSQLPFLTRSAIAAEALSNSRIILVDSVAAALAISNRYAPEHLILQIENAREVLADVRNTGSVFLGHWAPESVGDYCTGTNHVLPTYGHAKSYSGLGVEHFMRQTTVQELTREGLQNIADAVICLATLEGLDAHAAAVTRRLASQE